MIKNIFLFLSLVGFALPVASQSDTLTVRIKAMRCGDCAHKVRMALRQDPGVGTIDINLERRTATIAYNPAVTCTDSIEARLVATKRYKPSPYSKDDIIRRGYGQRMDDMHCQRCADRIVGRLQTMAGIDSLAPHLDKHYMFIRYDANRTCRDSIRQVINSMGFTPVNYYTSDKVAFAYYNIPEEACTQATVDSLMLLLSVDDVNVNPLRRSLAVTYFCKELSEAELLAEIRKLGIEPVVPAPHECTEKETNLQ